MNVAYRDIDEKEFVLVWPPALERFEII
jgi:hypothetical protein